MKVERLLYPDICKFVAIFIVTWSHCAQRVSGMIWTNFLGGLQMDIAFTMPLFMLMSGWFINLDKMRNTPIRLYILSKFKRLIVPSFVWYIILSLFSFCLPDLSIFSYYWYLNALFVCLCVIMICSKIINNNLLCCLVSTTLLLLIPYSDFSHINFMIPFLWAGYGLRIICRKKYAQEFIILCSIVGLFLCTKWKYNYSVYSSPFNSWFLDLEMVKIMIYRFILGLTISSVIIYVIMKKENTWISKLSKYGSYSLIIYTFSLAFLGLVSRLLNFLCIHTNRYGVIDVLSLFLCLLIIVIAILFADICRKKKILSQLFLGE